MNWTDERVELLKKLWAEGLSASQIAAQLGGVSRNAVIGKVHRLKLSSRARAKSPSPRPKKTGKPASGGAGRTSAPAPRMVTTSIGATALKAEYIEDAMPDVIARPLVGLEMPEPRKLALTELTERTCKWPIGDPLSEDFFFCGNDPAETGPYCAYHSRLAFQPASERKRLR